MRQNSKEVETDAQDWSDVFDNGKSVKQKRMAKKQEAKQRRKLIKEMRDEDDWN